MVWFDFVMALDGRMGRFWNRWTWERYLGELNWKYLLEISSKDKDPACDWWLLLSPLSKISCKVRTIHHVVCYAIMRWTATGPEAFIIIIMVKAQDLHTGTRDWHWQGLSQSQSSESPMERHVVVSIKNRRLFEKALVAMDPTHYLSLCIYNPMGP